MIAVTLLLSAAVSAIVVPASRPDAPPPVAGSAAKARLPGFASQLAIATPIVGPQGWRVISKEAAWAALAAATPATRQAARWAYARSLIGAGRGEEARGVLETMLADDVDLTLVQAFQLATGVARTQARDARGGLEALGSGTAGSGPLAGNPEACAWRLRALTLLDRPEPALTQLQCALPALNARAVAARVPFLYAGARAALAASRPAAVKMWLSALPNSDAGANLYRGRAELALGNISVARMHLARTGTGSPEQRIDARVSLLEADLAVGPAAPERIRQIDNLALIWRGDAVERRVLRLSYRIGVARHDLRRSLAAGAALVRHTRADDDTPTLLVELQALLRAGLAPGSALPIPDAAGLFWEYRDLAPAGAGGDFLASELADRLQDSGLYFRAAELLRHQLLQRTRDIAQGPLSARVASLFILAGKPAPALEVIRATEANRYPVEMHWERNRVAAVALYKLGRKAEALAVLQDMPDGGVIRAEIHWASHDWPALAGEIAVLLPETARLSNVEQAIILRHAIALAMLGREAELARLRERYTAAFADSPAAATFDLLTGDPASLDAGALTAAMIAIPSASPAGAIGDLFDVPAARARSQTAISADNRPD